MNKLTLLGVIGLAALVIGMIMPESGLMAGATGNNNSKSKNYDSNYRDDHHDDHEDDDHHAKKNDTSSIRVYKVVINNVGNPLPSMASFGIKLNNTLITVNATILNVTQNKPITLTESGMTGYSFVEIRGDGHCPQNLGGTITLDSGQHIDCYIVNQPTPTGEVINTPPTVKIYKVVINSAGNPTPSTESFGLSINGGATLSNGTQVTLQTNTPAILNESGLSGYEFVEIRGDGHCPENLGGTITLDAGQNITCYVVNQPINPVTPIQPGVIFHYNTMSFSFANMTYGNSCSKPGSVPPCVELANSNDGNVLVVDPKLQTDTTIVLFSVVETNKVTQSPPQFATSPICILSGVGPHTADYAQDPDTTPVVNPSGQMGFEFQCSLIEADNFKISYALIETQR